MKQQGNKRSFKNKQAGYGCKGRDCRSRKNGEEQKKNKETDAIVEKISDIADASMEELKYRNINKARAGYTDALGMYNNLPEDRKKR